MHRFAHRPRRSLAYPAALVLALLPGCGGDAALPGDVDYGPGHAVPRLLSETASVTPGEPFTLGVTFDIEPRWHLYWNGLNDTGYPIQVQPELPEGFRPGDLQWPAPERKISPGDILDHVYSGRVTLLLPVHPPRDLEPGSEVTLVCRLDWLACKEVCVPGQGVASVTLPVRGPAGGDGERERRRAAETAGGEETLRRFREARERLPVPATVPPPGVRWTWTEGAFVVEADGARRLAFYPYLDSAPLASLLRDGASETGRLTLHPAENPGTPGVLSGVLEIDPGPPGRSTFHALAIPPNENP